MFRSLSMHVEKLKSGLSAASKTLGFSREGGAKLTFSTDCYQFVLSLMLVSMVGLYSGCDPKPEPQSADPQPMQPDPIPEPDPAPPGQTEEAEAAEPAEQTTQPAADVTLQKLDWKSIQALVREQQGKVVVVDFWATYCPPCIAEFPNLVELHRTMGDRVACISISLDYDGLDESTAPTEEKVLRFLHKQQATCTNILCTTDSETMFNENLEHASIPIVFVFNKAGELAGQFPDLEDPAEFTYQADVLPLVQKLLASE